VPLIASGGASLADVHEMALQSFRIKFLATRAAALDLPENPIARACRQEQGSKVRCNFRVSLIGHLREVEYRGSGLMSLPVPHGSRVTGFRPACGAG
jgi:hypothetical protein